MQQIYTFTKNDIKEAVTESLNRYSEDMIWTQYDNIRRRHPEWNERQIANNIVEKFGLNSVDYDEILDYIYEFDSEQKDSINEDVTLSQVRDEIEDSFKSNEFKKAVHNVVVDVMNSVLNNIWNKKALLQSFLRKK